MLVKLVIMDCFIAKNQTCDYGFFFFFFKLINIYMKKSFFLVRASPVGMLNGKCKDYLALGATNHPAFGLVNVRNCKFFYNCATETSY